MAFILMLFFAGAFCFAEENDLESRLKSVEESLDQMKRDKTEESVPSLTQSLDWGRGWGLGINTGTLLNAPAFGLDLESPMFFNHFRAELTTMVWMDEKYPEPISYPNLAYCAAGGLGGLRVAYYSPLYFNFMRIYGGLGADAVGLVGAVMDFSKLDSYENLSAEERMAMLRIASGITSETFAGVEVFMAKKQSAYLELVSDWVPIISHYWIADKDMSFFKAVNAMPGKGGMGVTLKIGLRFYF
jgi:hypothetical protein